jgi:hypothetical protein
MRRLSDRPAFITLLMVLAAVGGYVVTATLKGTEPNSNPGTINADQPFQSTPAKVASVSPALPDGSLVEVDASYPCRRVLGDNYNLYNALFATNQSVTTLRVLSNGDQVGLVDPTARLGFDNQYYVQVTAPYNSSNSVTGFMRARSNWQSSSLGMCNAPLPPVCDHCSW